jgi:hypothetical protein
MGDQDNAQRGWVQEQTGEGFYLRVLLTTKMLGGRPPSGERILNAS